MIYVLSNDVLVPGKMSEFYEIATMELAPLYPKVGMNLAGSFRAISGNINSGYALYAYNDLAAFQKAREAQKKDLDFQKVSAKLSALRVSISHTILEPNAWSPLK